MKHYAKNYVKDNPMTNPLILVANIKSSTFNLTGLNQFKSIERKMKLDHNIVDFRILPIITNSSTYINQRAKQIENYFKKYFFNNDNKNNKLVNINFLCFSFANLPLNIFMSNYKNLFKNFLIKSVIYVASPNKGCLFSETFNSNNETSSLAIRGNHVYDNWLLEEYNNKYIKHFNEKYSRDPEINYYSISSGLNDFNYRNSYTYANIFNYDDEFIINDGIISVDESKEDNHIKTYDIDHYALLGQGSDSDKCIDDYATQAKLIDFLIN